jgi:hypothetical protein
MKNVIASAGLIALGAAGVQTAQAQIPVVGTEKPWSVAATLRGFYDDNYNTQPSGPGRRHSFGFEARPSVGVNLPLEDTTVTLGYTLDMKYYDDRKQNSADWSHDFEAFINHNFDERHSIDFRDSFVIAQEPEVLDRSLSTVLRSDGNNIRNLAVLNFHAQFTRLFGIAAGYSNTYYNYQDRNDTATRTSFATLLNRFEHLFTLDTRWQVLPTTTGILGYQFGWVDYTRDRIISPGFTVTSKERNDRSQYFYVGGEHAFRRDLSAKAKVGLEYTDYYNSPTGRTTWSPYAEFSVNYDYMDDGNLAVGFRHSRNQTDLPGVLSNTDYTTDEESSALYATVTQKLTPISPNLSASLTGQYQHSAFHGGSLNSLADDIYLIGLNIAYQFNHYLSAEVGYNYDKISSDVVGRAYDRNRVYIGVTGSY